MLSKEMAKDEAIMRYWVKNWYVNDRRREKYCWEDEKWAGSFIAIAREIKKLTSKEKGSGNEY